jgi:hypothetical protein
VGHGGAPTLRSFQIVEGGCCAPGGGFGRGWGTVRWVSPEPGWGQQWWKEESVCGLTNDEGEWRWWTGERQGGLGSDYGWWGSSADSGTDAVEVRAVGRCAAGEIGHRQVGPGGF